MLKNMFILNLKIHIYLSIYIHIDLEREEKNLIVET